MREHDFCRLSLRSVMEEIRKEDPKRYVSAEVTGDVKMGNEHHYWVKVSDTRDPGTGSAIPPNGAPGHARFLDYEVTGCCRYSAKFDAIRRLRRDLDKEGDAALIAAAPEMLEALRGVAERCASQGYVGVDGQYLKVVRAAIAKAEGRQP
jgi:hypothetical protein